MIARPLLLKALIGGNFPAIRHPGPRSGAQGTAIGVLVHRRPRQRICRCRGVALAATLSPRPWSGRYGSRPVNPKLTGATASPRGSHAQIHRSSAATD